MKTLHLSRRARSRALVFTLFATPSLAFASSPVHASAASCSATYTVRPGDTLWGISQACGISVSTLRQLNRLESYLRPGQILQLEAAAAAAPAGSTGVSGSGGTYIVQPGDTLEAIAARLHIAPDVLARLNGLTNRNLIRAGQALHWDSATPAAAPSATVPSGGYTFYRVQPGDTLWDIANAQHVPVPALATLNGLANGRLLRVGSVIRIPAAASGATAPASTATAAPSTTTIVQSGVYRVQPGDNLWTIAQSLGLTSDALASTNGLDLSKPLLPGQVLRYAIVTYNGPSLAEVGSVLDQQSAQVGIENALLKAIAWRESSWRMVDAPDGGMGVMQLMPDTVRWLQATYVPGNWDPHNLTDNVHAGAMLLLVYSRFYNNDIASIATAYHGGMGAVGQPPTPEMQHYVNSVMAFRQAFLNGAFPQ